MGGSLVASGLSSALGDATWSLSTGLGSCLVAGIYEVGRPDRLSPEEANQLDEQYADFGELFPFLPPVDMMPFSDSLSCLPYRNYDMKRLETIVFPHLLMYEKEVEGCQQSGWGFAVQFADERLQPRGSCHETEIFTAFRRSNARYRREDTLPDATLRRFIRTWAKQYIYPTAERTGNGFFKRISLRERIDPFTGATAGTASASESRAG